MKSDTTLDLLRSFPATLERLVGEANSLLDYRPDSWEGIPSEMLTVRQQVCHCRDIEIDGYYIRFSRVLYENEPQLPAVETYELVEARDYDTTDVASALSEFAIARRRTLELLESIDAKQLDRRGHFEGYGPVTLRSLVYFLASHDQQHVAGIQWLMGKRAAG
jgi:hypothetical protein